jgi:hypothetical protein
MSQQNQACFHWLHTKTITANSVFVNKLSIGTILFLTRFIFL